jgi:hypothetical protein
MRGAENEKSALPQMNTTTVETINQEQIKILEVVNHSGDSTHKKQAALKKNLYLLMCKNLKISVEAYIKEESSHPTNPAKGFAKGTNRYRKSINC